METSNKKILTLAQRMALGSKLKNLREAKQLSQLEVAETVLGYKGSHAAVSRLERGTLSSVEDVALTKLANFYGVSVEALWEETQGRVEDMEPNEYRPVDFLVVSPGFGARLFNVRQCLGLTKEDMAVLLGYVPSSKLLIHQWEKEEVKPKPDTLLDIAVKVGISAAWLITGARAKPAHPTFAMRLRAVQKIHGYTNRDVAVMANMDAIYGVQTIASVSRGSSKPSKVVIESVAEALDVPVSWIAPPEEGYEPVKPKDLVLHNLKPRAAAFIHELTELFELEQITEAQIGSLRARFMKDIMSTMKNKRAA